MESNRYCDTRQKLAEQFAVSARLYSEAVVTLTRFPSLTQAEYTKLREAVEKAQARATEARAQFEEHVERHRCGLADYRAKSV